MQFDYIFASLIVAALLSVFHPVFGVIFYLAASVQTDWEDWWKLTLISLVFLLVTVVLKHLNRD